MATKVLLDGRSIIDLEGVRAVEVRNNAVLVEPRHGTTIKVALDSELVRRAFAGTVLTFQQGERLPQCVRPPNATLSLVDYIRRQIREEGQEGDTFDGLTKRIKVEVDTSELDEALEKLERVREVQADDQIEHCAGLALFAAKGDSWTQADQHQFLNDFKEAVDTRDEAKEMLRLFAGPDDVPESWEVRDRSKGRRQRTQDRDLAELDGADD